MILDFSNSNCQKRTVPVTLENEVTIPPQVEVFDILTNVCLLKETKCTSYKCNWVSQQNYFVTTSMVRLSQ